MIRLLVDLRVLLVVLGLYAVACAGPPPLLPPPALATHEQYVVGSPDELVLTVLPEPVYERSLTVRPDGMISVELIGDVEASGRTIRDIASEIQGRLREYKRGALASLALAAARSNQVTVSGEVLRPGTFELVRDTRVADAIGLTGGETVFASKGKLKVIRSDGAETLEMAVELDAIQRGDLSTNVLLAGGDLIVVPPNRWAQAGYKLQSALFPLQQILSATISAVPLAAIF